MHPVSTFGSAPRNFCNTRAEHCGMNAPPAIYSTIRPARGFTRALLTFVQLLSQLEGLLIRRIAVVVNFVEVQLCVGERLLLEGVGAPLHQNRRRMGDDVELQAQTATEHCKVR